MAAHSAIVLEDKESFEIILPWGDSHVKRMGMLVRNVLQCRAPEGMFQLLQSLHFSQGVFPNFEILWVFDISWSLCGN